MFGHGWASGGSEFPAHWKPKDIAVAIEQMLNDGKKTSSGSSKKRLEVAGVMVEVVIKSESNQVATAYPVYEKEV